MANSFCHVFWSFRGETRDTFTCFLYQALKDNGFETFMDKEAIRVGDEVDSRIREGIKGSMSAIIVFSKNYAFSTWCLDELLLILERKKSSGYFIIPIFYDVEPADIKYQQGNYGDALKKHNKRHKDEVENWRKALKEVGNILGEQVQGQGKQRDFIEKFVKLFREKLSYEFPEVRLPLPKNPVLPANDKVVLYTSEQQDSKSTNGLVKSTLRHRNIEFEERNFTKEPKYITELEEPVGKEDSKYVPRVIVNVKNLRRKEEEVKVLEGFGNQLEEMRHKAYLSLMQRMAKSMEKLNALREHEFNITYVW